MIRNLGTLSGNVLGAVTIPTPADLVSGLVNVATQGQYGPVTNPVPQVPAACWDKPNFKACQSWAISSPYSDCQARAKAENWPESELKNCLEDKYRYRMNNNCIGSCANGTVSYPGMPVSTTATATSNTLTILNLQKLANAFMIPLGYTRLDEDGVLGKKTCGAVRQFYPDQVPGQCASVGYTAPVKQNVVVAQPVVTPVVKPVTTPKPVTTTLTASMLSGGKWLIGGSIAVALGIVAVAVAKKKGMLK